jgi:hypothetical protein
MKAKLIPHMSEEKECAGCGRKIKPGSKAIRSVDIEFGKTYVEFYHWTRKCCEETFHNFKKITCEETELVFTDD